MAGANTVEAQDLYLAAVLILGGACIEDIRHDGKMGTVVLGVSHLDVRRLAEEFRHLVDALESMTVSTQGVEWLYNSTVLGRMDTECRRLKKVMVQRRDRGVTPD